MKKRRCKKADREYKLLKRYGLILDDYNILLDKQGGRCKICGVKTCSAHKHLSVDHDHKTGKIRGLLCSKCNRGLGHFQDSKRKLLKAIWYLK